MIFSGGVTSISAVDPEPDPVGPEPLSQGLDSTTLTKKTQKSTDFVILNQTVPTSTVLSIRCRYLP